MFMYKFIFCVYFVVKISIQLSLFNKNLYYMFKICIIYLYNIFV